MLLLLFPAVGACLYVVQADKRAHRTYRSKPLAAWCLQPLDDLQSCREK